MRASAAIERQAELEGIGGIGGMDMQVAKQDLFGLRVLLYL